jgi:hypothetical protein
VNTTLDRLLPLSGPPKPAAFEKSWADMLADIRSKSGALAS